MLRIGLTGGTGSGKSTVARRLGDLGAVVVDADLLAREVLAPGSDGLAAVVEEFGPGVVTADGELDRAALAEVAFAAPERRRALEAITHPRIAALTAARVAAAPADAVLVHDVPLLVEKGMGPGYHLVVVVDAPPELRVRRLVGRGMAAADARRRMTHQASEDQRRAAADVWLDNAGTAEEVQDRVDRLWYERLVPFRDALEAGRAAPPPDGAGAVAADPTWPDQAARLGARVRAALGGLAASLVDPGVVHVGATAGAGTGPDLIELDVVVGPSGDLQAVADRVRAAGFAPLPAAAAPLRLGSCDPGRPAVVHVRR